MDTKKLKVLVVEDSGLIVQRLYSILSEIPFIKSIAHARNGEEALTLLSLMNPGLIVLDIKLPVLNGIEVLKHIKEEKRETCIVMLTNYPDEQYKSACMDLGADYFLDKSSEFDRIMEIVSSLENKLPVS